MNLFKQGVTSELSYKNFNIINDFSISVKSVIPSVFISLLFYLWIIGTAIFLTIGLFGVFNLKYILDNHKKINNPSADELFYQLKNELNLYKRKIKLVISDKYKLPFSFSLLDSFIVIPLHILNCYKQEDIKFVIMHELIHYKNKD